ncbi:histone-lysine N-methyltransferase SETMAR-like [Apis mellifera carnica]|nr:histone-lysine N-methyltransferase SETMAR-like [Apis mellifera carnica]
MLEDRTEKFETGDFDLSDKPRSGRPSLIDDDVVKAMLEQDPFLTTSEIVERLNSAQQTISDHIRKIGLVWKYSRWVPQ